MKSFEGVGSWDLSPQGDDWKIQLSQSNDEKMLSGWREKAANAKQKIRLIFHLIFAEARLALYLARLTHADFTEAFPIFSIPDRHLFKQVIRVYCNVGAFSRN